VEQLNFPLLAQEVPKFAKTVLEFGPSGGAAKLLLREQEGSGLLVLTSRLTDDTVSKTVHEEASAVRFFSSLC
jgi:hypothetical protein